MKLPKMLQRMRARVNEKGFVAVWYVMMMPVLVGALGLAVDVGGMEMTKNGLQNSLDAATQGTLALSKNKPSGPSLTAAEARASVIRLYDANRSGIHVTGSGRGTSIPFLECQTTSATPSVANSFVRPSASKCGFTLERISYSSTGALAGRNYLTVTVKETARPIFLQMLKIDKLTYTVTSTARLTNSWG